VKDIRTLVWKEFRILASHRNSLLVGYAVIALSFGVFMLLDSGAEIAVGEVTRPLLVFSGLAVVLASSQTARSFAGERESKTLASLLTTRISDRDLFLGKTLSIVLFSSAVLAVTGILHLLSINTLGRPQGGWVLYQAVPGRVGFMVLLPASILCLTSVLGVLISLRVRSIRGAYLLNLFSGVPALGLAAAAVTLEIEGRSRGEVLAGAVVLLWALIAGAAHLAIRRFRRETIVVET
jgi:ABC-type Na+ efflux pump permease subunit